MRKPGFVSLTVALVVFIFGSVSAQTTEFTYQGNLRDGPNLANGNYDLEFLLFGSLGGPDQIGSTVTRSGIAVTNGIFTVSLDFGTQFPGAGRFLEIHVRPSGGGSFTPLAPRQRVNSSPYSIKSIDADNATNATTSTNATQLGGLAADQYVKTGDARLTDARNPLPGSGSYIQNTSSAQPSSNFNISGNGTAAGVLSASIVNATTQYNVGGERILGITGVDNLFAGVGAGSSTTGINNSFFGKFAGSSNTTGQQNSFFGERAGVANSSGGLNSFFGAEAGRSATGIDNSFFGASAGYNTTSGDGNSFFGVLAGDSNATGSDLTIVGFHADVGSSNLTNATAIGFRSVVSQDNSLVLGSITGTNGGADTNVGIGTTAPAATLHIQRDGNIGANWQNSQLRIGGKTDPARPLNLGYDTTGNRGVIQAGQANVAFRDLLLNPNGGNVGIGINAAPDNLLTVNGSADKPGGGSWGTFSDERLKNIESRFTPGLKAVMQLQPIRYRYKPDNALGIKAEGEFVGFSAQAVEQVIPDAVSKNDKGYRLVNNDPIMWTMLNAIKEQQAEIETQQELNDIQRKQISTLLNANAALSVRLRAVEKRLAKKRGSARPH